VIGFLYTFMVEGFVGFIPGQVREWTILYYTRSLTGIEQQAASIVEMLLGKQEPPSHATCVAVLVAVALVGLVVAAVLVRIREFAQRGVGTV
jgi:hypothetical protein